MTHVLLPSIRKETGSEFGHEFFEGEGREMHKVVVNPDTDGNVLDVAQDFANLFVLSDILLIEVVKGFKAQRTFRLT